MHQNLKLFPTRQNDLDKIEQPGKHFKHFKSWPLTAQFFTLSSVFLDLLLQEMYSPLAFNYLALLLALCYLPAECQWNLAVAKPAYYP